MNKTPFVTRDFYSEKKSFERNEGSSRKAKTEKRTGLDLVIPTKYP